MPAPTPVNKILIIELRGIGDIILASPLVRVLHRNYPHAAIDMLVRSDFRHMLAHHPLIRRAIGFDRPYFKRHRAAWRQLMRELRREGYDLAINLYPVERHAFMAWWTGARWRGGYRGKWWGCHALLNYAVPEREDLHATEGPLQTIIAMGITDLEHQGLELYPGPEDIALADAVWSELDLPAGAPVVGIHYRSPLNIKNWPESHVAALIDLLRQRGVQPVLLGSSRDVEAAARINELASAPAPLLTGRLRLLELAAWFRRCALVVTVDSGPMHIAASQGTPCVALFGPSDERRYGPCGGGHRIVRAEYQCPYFPCRLRRGVCDEKAYPQGAPCMQAITPEQVADAVAAQFVISC
ncbi:MAG: glycosyltransferase family 9 protein [Armatimonadota bacterium]